MLWSGSAVSWRPFRRAFSSGIYGSQLLSGWQTCEEPEPLQAAPDLLWKEDCCVSTVSFLHPTNILLNRLCLSHPPLKRLFRAFTAVTFNPTNMFQVYFNSLFFFKYFLILCCDYFPFLWEVAWGFESMLIVSQLWAVSPYMASSSKNTKITIKQTAQPSFMFVFWAVFYCSVVRSR